MASCLYNFQLDKIIYIYKSASSFKYPHFNFLNSFLLSCLQQINTSSQLYVFWCDKLIYLFCHIFSTFLYKSPTPLLISQVVLLRTLILSPYYTFTIQLSIDQKWWLPEIQPPPAVGLT